MTQPFTRFLPKLAQPSFLVVAATTLMVGLSPSVAMADGVLFAPELMTKPLKKRYPAYISPRIWVYDDGGKLIGKSEGYPTAQKIRLPEGWYRIEVGNERQAENRARLFVLDGHVTTIPMGLALLETDSEEAQPTDLCRTWDAAFEIALPVGDGAGLPVGSNFRTDRHQNGAVQVLAGYYRVVWNGLWIAAEIKAGHAFRVPTSMAGPMTGPGYRLHVRKKATSNNPGLKMCERRPTRVLSRRYWVSILRRLSQPPFRERVWAPFDVDKPDGDLYARIKEKRPKGKHYKGTGHAPFLLWEIPEEPQSVKPQSVQTPVGGTATPPAKPPASTTPDDAK